MNRFIEVNDYGEGWYLKVPFTANNLAYSGRRCNSYQIILMELEAAIKNNLKSVFPYLLLQPKVPNAKEYKVIMHNGTCKYFHQIGKSKYFTPKVGSPTYIEVMEFAKKVYDELASRSTSVILTGLVRIDIMRAESTKIIQEGSKSSRLVVNEVEGIDSNYSSSNSQFQVMTQNFLQQHWAEIVNLKLKKFL